MEYLYPQTKDQDGFFGTLSSENTLLQFLQDRCGKENFRPRLDIVETLAAKIIGIDYKDAFKVFTIGGTNGKGEVALNVSHQLTLNNVDHGLLMSPHVFSICERLSFNGVCIDHEELYESLKYVLKQSDDISETPSFYEALFLSFLYLAKKKNIDTLVLEVGLGGKFDAVNILNPSYSAIVSISRDHCEILGNRLEEILSEKLGICRAGVPLVTGVHLNYLKQQINDYAEKEQFQVFYSEPRDDYKQSNLEIVKKLIELSAHNFHCKSFTSRSRGQQLSPRDRAEVFWTFGSHNPNGLEELLNSFRNSNQKFDRICFSFSDRNEEDLQVMLKLLHIYPCVSKQLIFLIDDHFKKVCKDKLKVQIQQYNIKQTEFKNLPILEGNTLVIGSYYLIGELFKTQFLRGENV